MSERERDRSRERVPPTLTPEERDAMERSRKKMREEGGVFSGSQILVPRVEDWMSDGEPADDPVEVAKKSYKEAGFAKDDDVEMSDDDDDWWKGDGWKSRIEVEATERGPNIRVSPEFREKLAKKWSMALIVRLLGRMVREDLLAKKLQQLWGRKGKVETMEIGSGFFLVKLSSQEDYEFALTGGPWVYMDHYLAVQQWKSGFDPEDAEVSKIAAWIRIPKFPVDLYEKGILYVVGSQVGKVLRVDKNTTSQTKGRFARICVEIDLTKPLLPSLLIDGKEKKIVYEGLHLICFSCGKYGHDADHCSENNTVKKPLNGHMGTASEIIHEQESPTNVVETRPEFGEWMVVSRRRRVQRGAGNGMNYHGRVVERDLRQNGGLDGSRFSAFADVNEGDQDHADMEKESRVIARDYRGFESQQIQGIKNRSLLRRDPHQDKLKKVAGDGFFIHAKGTRKNSVVSPMETYIQVKNKMANQGLEKAGPSNYVGKSKDNSNLVDHIKVTEIKDISSGSIREKGQQKGGKSIVAKINVPSKNNTSSNPIDPGECGRGNVVMLLNPLGVEDTVARQSMTKRNDFQ